MHVTMNFIRSIVQYHKNIHDKQVNIHCAIMGRFQRDEALAIRLQGQLTQLQSQKTVSDTFIHEIETVISKLRIWKDEKVMYEWNMAIYDKMMPLGEFLVDTETLRAKRGCQRLAEEWEEKLDEWLMLSMEWDNGVEHYRVHLLPRIRERRKNDGEKEEKVLMRWTMVKADAGRVE